MTFRESLFVTLLADYTSTVRKQGFVPDFENATKVVRKRVKVIMDQLEKEGWLM